MVVGVVVGGLGLLQKTLWAPEDTITATAEIDADKPAVIIDPGLLNLYETPATRTVKRSGDLTIAQAPIDNVEAWAGESAYDRVTGLAAAGELTTKATDGEEQVLGRGARRRRSHRPGRGGPAQDPGPRRRGARAGPRGRRAVAVPGDRHRAGRAGMGCPGDPHRPPHRRRGRARTSEVGRPLLAQS